MHSVEYFQEVVKCSQDPTMSPNMDTTQWSESRLEPPASIFVKLDSTTRHVMTITWVKLL